MRPPAGLPPVGGGLVAEGSDRRLQPDCEGPCILAFGGHERVSEGDSCARRVWQGSALAEDPSGALEVDGHNGHVAPDGQKGRSSTELLAPSVRAPAAFRVEQDAPAVVDQVSGHVRRFPADPAPFDGYGAHGECCHCTAHPVAEEVVGGCSYEQPVTPWVRDGREQEGGVGVAVVVGHKDHCAIQAIQAVHAAAVR